MNCLAALANNIQFPLSHLSARYVGGTVGTDGEYWAYKSFHYWPSLATRTTYRYIRSGLTRVYSDAPALPLYGTPMVFVQWDLFTLHAFNLLELLHFLNFRRGKWRFNWITSQFYLNLWEETEFSQESPIVEARYPKQAHHQLRPPSSRWINSGVALHIGAMILKNPTCISSRLNLSHHHVSRTGRYYPHPHGFIKIYLSVVPILI